MTGKLGQHARLDLQIRPDSTLALPMIIYVQLYATTDNFCSLFTDAYHPARMKTTLRVQVHIRWLWRSHMKSFIIVKISNHFRQQNSIVPYPKVWDFFVGENYQSGRKKSDFEV